MHYCLVGMDMIGWFCWWHDDTPVVPEMDMIGWFCWWHDNTPVVRQ
ncbi:hypothetical protein HanXRQr2_Chr09g0391411 [Helianthus annuus]|uniref:Uncharacterized protein n=1 Tax=Helianthus annuus TaxID=4232 RepID=A0A9K3I622_HELAN|nr:hypothetical protein HanXRQr2_Chr09g0391411 [Helianthus annuus]